MIATVLVMLLGAGVCACGVLQVGMYFVGVVLFSIGAIGFLVWLVETAVPLLRWLRWPER
jgi:hypothetical protein